jgi:hypothetical protein
VARERQGGEREASTEEFDFQVAVPRPDGPGRDDREFWRSVLLGGRLSSVPRWTRSAGVAAYHAVVPTAVVAGLRRLADSWSVPLSAMLLTAHARVLAVLCGERDVTTGYVPSPGRAPLPCRVSTEPATWRELVHGARHAQTELLAHLEFPVVELRPELGLTGPCFETVFDPTGGGGVLDSDTVLWVGVVERGGELVLRARYRRNLLDRRR